MDSGFVPLAEALGYKNRKLVTSTEIVVEVGDGGGGAKASEGTN